MSPQKFAFVRNQILPENEAAISIFDKGFLFGEGCFATLKIVDGGVQFLDAHLDRLSQQCGELGIAMPHFEKNWIWALLEKNAAQKGAWRLKMIISAGNREKSLEPSLMMLLSPIAEACLNEKRVCIYPTPLSKPSSRLKSLAYLDRFYVERYAQDKGFDDAWVISPEGHIMEGAFSNIFWTFQGRYFTPDPELPFLQGVTIRILAKALGMEYTKAKEIPLGSQIFSCNSIRGIVPLVEVNGVSFARDAHVESHLASVYNKLIFSNLNMLI